MKHARQSKYLYIGVHISSLRDIPQDKSEYKSEALNTKDMQQAMEQKNVIRAIIFSEGLLVGCVKLSESDQEGTQGMDIGKSNTSGVFTVFYESVVFCPTKKIVEITGPDFMPQEIVQDDAVRTLPEYQGELLWNLSVHDVFSHFSIANYCNYSDYISFLESTSTQSPCCTNPVSSPADIIVELMCGRRPLKYEIFRKYVFDLLENPDGIVIFRRLFAQGIQIHDLINLLEDILTDFVAFTNFLAAKEVFEYLMQELSPYASLLKEVYLVVDSSLSMLLKTESGAAIVMLLLKHLPEVGKKSMANALASQSQAFSNNTHLKQLFQFILTDGACKETFMKALERS